MKLCAKCNENKELSQYKKNDFGKYLSYCQACVRRISRERYRRQRDAKKGLTGENTEGMA